MDDPYIQEFNFPTFKRGDTFPSRIIRTEQPLGTPMAITSALMQIRTKDGTLVYEWKTTGNSANATITGDGDNEITLGEIPYSTAEGFPPGDHRYDLEVIFTSGLRKLTILQGLFPVSADVSKPTSA